MTTQQHAPALPSTPTRGGRTVARRPVVDRLRGRHAYWAAGGRWALPDEMDVRDNPPLLVIDLVAVPLLLTVHAAPAIVEWVRRARRAFH
jgi:hypothetical protein